MYAGIQTEGACLKKNTGQDNPSESSLLLKRNKSPIPSDTFTLVATVCVCLVSLLRITLYNWSVI